MKKNLALAAVSTLLTLLVAELAAVLWLNFSASSQHLSAFGTFEQIICSRKLLFARHHYLQYIPAPNYKQGPNRHNALGFRGDEIVLPKPSTTYRIVAMGGSTTYTSSVGDYRLAYPTLLQENLRHRGYSNVEVINAGVPAYSSWETLLSFELRVLDIEPDLVIIYHGINDVHPRLVFPYDAYRGDNSGSRSPFSPPSETIWDQSTILRIIRTRLKLRQSLGGLGFRRTFEYVPTNFSDEHYNQMSQNQYPSGIFETHPVTAMLAKNPPVYFERNLRNLIAVAHEHEIKVMLTTWAWSPRFTEDPRASSPEFDQALTEHNAVISRLCATHDVLCLDFAAAMPTEPQYWVDGRHMNETGTRLKAEIFADFLDEMGTLPRP